MFNLSQCLNCHDFFYPTNIYSLCTLDNSESSSSEPSMIFVSTSNNIYVISGQDHDHHHDTTPSSTSTSTTQEHIIHQEFPIQEIPIYSISRIPTDSQIISMSCFKSNYDKNKIILGVTFTQPIQLAEELSKNREYEDKESSVEDLDDEDYLSSSYDSAGGGDSTDDEDHQPHNIKKKKKKIGVRDNLLGKTFVSHSKNSEMNASSMNSTMNDNRGEQESDDPSQSAVQQYNSYFHIYLLDEDEILSNKSTTSTKHKCIQTFVLGYVPLKLARQTVTLHPSMQQFSMFVLCGSDKSMHCFSDIIVHNIMMFLKVFDMPIKPSYVFTNTNRSMTTELANNNMFIEYDFIQMLNLPGSIIDYDSQSNILAVACQNGFIKCIQSSGFEFQCMLNSPVSSIKILGYRNNELTIIVGETIGRAILYTINVPTTALTLIQPSNTPISTPIMAWPTPSFVNSIQPPSIIYSDEFGDDITCIHTLKYCGGITDIYVGTYNRKLIVYQYDDENNTCIYKSTYHFECPIYGINTMDINRDGVKELIVCTMFELQILQPDLQSILTCLKERLKQH